MPAPAPAVRALLEASAAAWNRGDLDGFLRDYAQDASFVTSSGLVHGKDEIRTIYQRAYWADGQPRDGLRFRDLDIRRTGPRTAVAFGRFVLYDRASDDESRATGIFSLTLRYGDDGWKIVHDHSSSDE